MKISVALFISFVLSSCISISLQPNKEFAMEAKSNGSPIAISDMYSSAPNSAGGVDAHIDFVNASEKTIKYAVFGVAPYNRVGDQVASQIGNRSIRFLESVGPFEYAQGNLGMFKKQWSNVWYNSTIDCIKLTGIEVEYMDGEKVNITRNDINKALTNGLSNTCPKK